MSTPSLSIVIPVLNEELEIARIIEAASKHLGAVADEWEIIVVDNASTDRTVEIVGDYVDGKRVRLVRNEANRGKGYSIRRGMLKARGDLRLMCDADCTASLASLTMMVEIAQDADVVAGSRNVSGAKVTQQQEIKRRIVGFGFITLSRMVMGKLPRDIYCGFKLWRGECAEVIFGQAKLDGWAFDAETLAMAKKLGYRVKEVGIEWNNRPLSRLTIRNVAFTVVGELWTAKRNVRKCAKSARKASQPHQSIPDHVA